MLTGVGLTKTFLNLRIHARTTSFLQLFTDFYDAINDDILQKLRKKNNNSANLFMTRVIFSLLVIKVCSHKIKSFKTKNRYQIK